ncbi:hypothetical protein ACFV6B_33500 [Streptomyces microflavus]|uniref:hypothetical protein n=1 Tax=Streptomyces TaxID=1883 RepID=UPI0019126E93|nr:hypothetical protein [Streptomyces sp. MBT58]MBK5993338.1 hypothetical protein [Streptomyces sp. MBT58]
MTDDLTARIQALVVDPLAPLDPPAGLDLTITWHIPVGTITRTVHSDTEHEINQARLSDGLFVSAEDIARETATVTMVCPLCGAADRLAIVGRWGHPAQFSCGCGHQWQPYPRTPQWGIRSMMDAITTAVQNQGLPA